MPIKQNRYLKELLADENSSEQHAESITEKLRAEIIAGLRKWDPTLEDYNPLVEIAKLGLNDNNDTSTQLRAHTEIAHHMYPQIGRVEIHNQEDKKIDITIQIADFAKGDTVEIEPEDIEVEGDLQAEIPVDMTDEIKRQAKNYNEYVVKSLTNSKEESES